MALAVRVLLRVAVPALGGHVAEIIIRPPSRSVFNAMAARRGAGGFADEAVVHFAARLSGHSEGTIKRIEAADFAEVRGIVEKLYEGAARRFRTGRPANGNGESGGEAA